MIVIARKSGSMGNRLFTFAHFIANSLEQGNYKVYSPVFNEYSSCFTGTSNQIITCFPNSKSPDRCESGLTRYLRKILNYGLYSVTNPLRKDRIAWLQSPIHEVIDLHHPDEYNWQQTDFVNFVHKKMVTSNGWIFWDHEAFVRQAKVIREYFRPVPSIADSLNRYMEKCRADAPVLVGVHIRYGDYRTHCDGKYFYSIEQYTQLMQRVCTLHKKPVRFVVCSDEQPDVQKFGDLDVYLGPGNAVEDMYSLALCDYIIGPPSTFSGWASFWGQAPLYYVQNMETAAQTMDLHDFVPLNSFDYRSPTFRYEGAQ